MPIDTPPSVDAQLVADAIRAVQLTLQPPEGVAIADVPLDVHAWLQNTEQSADQVAGDLDVLWQEVARLDRDLVDQLNALNMNIRNIGSNIAYSFLEHPAIKVDVDLQPVVDALGELQDGLEADAQPIADALELIDQDLYDGLSALDIGAVASDRGLLEALTAAVNQVIAAVGPPVAKVLAQLVPDLTAAPSLATPALGAAFGATLWDIIPDMLAGRAAQGKNLGGAARAVAGEVTKSGGASAKGMFSAVFGDVADVLNLSPGSPEAIVGIVRRIADSRLNPLRPLVPRKPKEFMGPAIDAWLAAGAAGIVSHALAAIGSASILGSLAMPFQYMAAFAAKFAGWDSITDALVGSHHQAAIGIPARYNAMLGARPMLPSLPMAQEIIRRGLIEGEIIGAGQAIAPQALAELLGFAGYADDWHPMLRELADTPISARSLRQYVEFAPDDGLWLDSHLQRAGASPADRPVIAASARAYARRTWQSKEISALWEMRISGYLDTTEFQDRLTSAGVMSWAVDTAVWAAETERERRSSSDQVAEALLAYKTGQMSDDDLATELQNYVHDPGDVSRLCALARLRRYHTAYLLTPSQEALAGISEYRTAYLHGLVTEDVYREQMAQAGMQTDAIDLKVGNDSTARDRTMLSDFRDYELPSMRDALIHGALTIDDYAARLRADMFPAVYLDAELALAAALALRYQQGQVSARQLPGYESAYVSGLIPAAELEDLYREAGYTSAEIEARHRVLDGQRAAEDEKRRAALQAEQARVKKQKDAADKAAAREKERLARLEQAARDKERRLARQAAADLAKRLAALAKAAAEAANPGWPAKVRALRADLEKAFKGLGEGLPDEVWSAAVDLEVLLSSTPLPDNQTIVAAVSQVEQLLQASLGVTPSAPATT